MEKPSPGPLHVRVEALVIGARKAALGTIGAGGGAPHVSLVAMAAGLKGCPVLLLSGLARHTRNIMLDARASLLIDGTGTDGDPVTGARVTLEGVLATTQDPQDRQAFLAAHLSATDYCDFADFAFWRLTPHRAFLIEGFGRIHELDWAAA